MAYYHDRLEIYRHAAQQIDQILKGVKPQDIPFYPKVFVAVYYSQRHRSAVRYLLQHALREQHFLPGCWVSLLF
jgi:hypothetical protein